MSGHSIHVGGQPTFLLGVSLFDALGSTPPRDEDLDALRNWGVRAVRVWAHWLEPIYQADGTLSAQGRARLLQLVGRLQARGLILELVLLRPGQLPGQKYAAFSSEAARLRAVGEITTALRDARAVLFDLYNEHDHPDGPISHAAARTLRDQVKAVDPARVVTISSSGSHILSADGRMGDEGARNLHEEAGQEAGSVAVDVFAPHFPRSSDWAPATGARIGTVRAALDRLGRSMPIYLNEEHRADPPDVIAPHTYQHAFAGARQAGAAGWVFHTEAGFALARRPFVEALSADERAGLASLIKK